MFFRLQHLIKYRLLSCSNQRMIHIVVYMHIIGRFLMCIFRSSRTLPVCEPGGPNRPCGDAPSLFEGVRQSPRYDSGRDVSQGLGCTFVFLQAFGFCCICSVAAAARFPATQRANAGAGQKRVS